MFKETLVGIANRSRNRVGFVIPWELILAIITMIMEYCEGMTSADGFCERCKRIGPFAKWVLLWKTRQVIDMHNAGKSGFGSRISPRAAGPILDELFETVGKTESAELMKFHSQLTAVMCGADPDEV